MHWHAYPDSLSTCELASTPNFN